MTDDASPAPSQRSDDGESVAERGKGAISAVRRSSPFVDHLMTMLSQYGSAKGNMLAGAVTYFGFLSFFPILILAFAVTGYITGVYPGAEHQVTQALSSIFPGIVGGKNAVISVNSFQSKAAAAGVIGLVGLLYSGLNWVDALRQSLETMFAVPKSAQRGFVSSKLIDLVTLIVLGLVLVISVGLSTSATGFANGVLAAVNLDTVPGMHLLLAAVGILLGIGASMLLFIAMFKLLPKPDLPMPALARGALLGAVGFEVLKVAASYLIKGATQSPAGAIVGVSVVLLVWINYFSRLALYSAAWAVTSPSAYDITRARGLDFASSPGAPAPETALPSVTARTAAIAVTAATADAAADHDDEDLMDKVADVVRPVAAVALLAMLLRRVWAWSQPGGPVRRRRSASR